MTRNPLFVAYRPVTYIFPRCGRIIDHCVVPAAGGLEEDRSGVDDWGMWVRIANQERVVGHCELLSGIRVHGGNQSNDALPMFNLANSSS